MDADQVSPKKPLLKSKKIKIAGGALTAVILAAGIGLWSGSAKKPVAVVSPASAAVVPVPEPPPAKVEVKKNSHKKAVATKGGKKKHHRRKKPQAG